MLQSISVSDIDPIGTRQLERGLFDHLPALIVICKGEQLMCEYANHTFYRITEKDESILGSPIFDVFSEVVGQPVESLVKHVFSQGHLFNGKEVHVRLKKGGLLKDFWFDVLLQPHKGEGGQITGLLIHATDVTEFVKSKQQLDVSEQRFDKLKAALHGLALITDAEGHVLFASDDWSSFLGSNPSHLNHLQSKIHAFDLPLFEQLLQSDVKQGCAKAKEVRIQLIDGRYEWHSVKVEKIDNPLHPSQLIITLNNIHWQRSIPGMINSLLLDNTAVRSKERQLLYSIIDATEDVFVLFDTEMRYQLVNSRLEQLIGYSREALLGRSIIEKFPNLRGGHFVQDLQKSLGGQIVRTDRFYSPLTQRWFQNNFYPVQQDGTNEVTGVVFVGRDITNIIENEFRITEQNKELSKIKNVLTGLIDTSVELIMLVDKDFVVQMTNKKFESFVKKTKEELLGMHLLDVHPGYRGSLQYEALLRSLKGEMVHLDRRRSLAREDIYLDTYYVPQFENGEVTGVLVMSRDITDIVLYKRELEKRNSDLQRINKELNAFSFIASHDLQEPLRKIRTFIGMIPEEEKQLLSEQSRDYFQRMSNAAGRMQGLINDLLAYAQIDESSLNEHVDLQELLYAIKDEYDHVFTSGSAELHIGNLPIVPGNKVQLNQLFTNLISNAVKYRHNDRKCKIEVSCLSCDLPDLISSPQYIITVKDNGIGFEQAYADKIFGLFQRLHGRSSYSGNGIGLSICRRIAENHGGKIEAFGSPSEGSTFIIHLPTK